jgi:hypothetical protein
MTRTIRRAQRKPACAKTSKQFHNTLCCCDVYCVELGFIARIAAFLENVRVKVGQVFSMTPVARHSSAPPASMRRSPKAAPRSIMFPRENAPIVVLVVLRSPFVSRLYHPATSFPYPLAAPIHQPVTRTIRRPNRGGLGLAQSSAPAAAVAGQLENL